MTHPYHGCWRRRPFVGFVALLLALSPGLCAQAVNHRPTLTWIGDVRATPGATIDPIAVFVGDVETPADLQLSVESANPALLPLSGIQLSGTGTERQLSLSPAPGQVGSSTITLTATDPGGQSSATSFTLTVAATVAGNTPPLLQGVADHTLVAGPGARYGSMPLVVQDNELFEGRLILSKATSNPALVPINGIAFGGRNWGRSLTVTPIAGRTGRATITLGLSDGVNTTSTSFVLDVVAGNTEPAIIDLPTFIAPYVGETPQAVSFTVADAETAATDLALSATSSNEDLVASDHIVFGGTGASRTVTVTPQPGALGAATLTISISDGEITRQAKLLHVVRDPATQFNRARGVYILDSAGGTNYTTTFGKAVRLRDANIRDLPFVHGLALRAHWDEIESSTVPGAYDFHIIANALHKLPAGQRLSLIITPNDPAYLAATPGVTTWNDRGTIRAVPWDPYLRERRRALLTAMAAFEVDGVPLADHPALHLVDPYLPGGFTGIRNPVGTNLGTLPGFSRELFIGAVQDELRTLQDCFPHQFVQIGFWPVQDTFNAQYGQNAWRWYREQLINEFNGVIRPRIGYFVESLAAWRIGPDVDPFVGTPPAFSTLAALNATQDNGWAGLQMLGNWSRPFNDSHVDNTINGSPGDAMEYAYNVCRGQYFEVYITDILNPNFQAALQNWHDFVDGISVPDAPSGISGVALSEHDVDLVWRTVPEATGYEVERQLAGDEFISVYTGADTALVDSGLLAGTAYTYRIRSYSDHATSPWSAPLTITTPDLTPPEFVRVSASPSILWPANHKMVAVEIDALVVDNVDPSPDVRILAVTSNEPDDGLGDGATSGDWVIISDLSLELRAERAGVGDGRIYTITLEATDAAGNAATTTATVTVPHHR